VGLNKRHGRRPRTWLTLASMLMGTLILFSACGSDPNQATAQHNKTQLDAEMARARQMGVPASYLDPIATQEARAAAGAGGWGYSYQGAAATYAMLYSQLLTAEQQSSSQIKDKAQKSLDVFSAILTQRKAQGFSETATYQARLTQAYLDLGNAKTAADYGKVAIFASTQTEALTAMWPAYTKLQEFEATLAALQKVGIDTDWSQAVYTQDVQVFQNAASPDRYTQLEKVIDGQINQLVADRVEALPYVGQAMLQAFQARIDALHLFGEGTSAFQQQHDGDVRQLGQAQTLADYMTLAQTIDGQAEQMALPFARGQARHDLQVLQGLVTATSERNPLLDYEYADPARGIGNVTAQFDAAGDSGSYVAGCGYDLVCKYNSADSAIQAQMVNLRAMLDNLNDQTPAWEAHQTDLELMSHYGILGEHVTVVSLREQTARLYENGKLVYWSYITTGRYERPSPPGLHYAEWKAANIEFQPTEPIGSPIRGYPTPIHYAVYYYDYGFFLHDAWWRIGFGPGSNLPHWDPAAFDGGSHGCVNFPLQNMAWYYNWVQVGSPVLIY
jgi:lipoprotein-anchoring transpeptidase ErfK/SrfK